MAKTIEKQANLALRVDGSDSSKSEIEKVRTELESFGDAGTKSAQKFADSMSANDAAYQKLLGAIESGSPRQERVWAQLRLLTENYKKTIVDTFGSLEKAPPAAAAALEKYESRLQSVTTTVRQNKDAMSEMKTELGEGGEKWTGLGDAVNKALGPLGALQAKALLVGQAFSQGVSEGLAFDRWIGTDMSLWDEWSSRVASKVLVVVNAVGDNLVAIANVLTSIRTGSVAEMTRAVGELKDSILNGIKNSVQTVTLWGDEWDKAHPKVKAAADAVDGHTAATDKNSDALKKNTDQLQAATQAEQLFEAAKAETAARMKKLAEETDKLQKAIAKVTEEEAKETKALTAAQAAYDQAEINTINRTSDMQYQGRVVGEVTSELDKQKNEVQALTDKYGANDPMTLQAIQRQQQLQIQLENATQRYDDAKGDVAEYTKKQADANREIERAKSALAELGPELKKSQDALTNLNVPVGSLAMSMQKTAEHAPKAATGVDQFATAAKTAAEPTKAMADSMAKMPEASRQLGEALSASVITNTNAAAAAFKSVADQLDRCLINMRLMITMSGDLVGALDRVQQAAGKAAGTVDSGDDGAISYTNTSEAA